MNYDILKFITYKELNNKWDIKGHQLSKISSKYPIKKLENFIIERKDKIKLSDKPNERFGILGISNEVGMFDAYEEYGKNIKQKYKIVAENYIAYNPYRVNVGSIGIKNKKLKNLYISPAYVVFSCKEQLLPEYLFILMKSSIFNKLVKENTTGSVRQTLSFSNLSKISIPIPSLEKQNNIVKKFYERLKEVSLMEEKGKKTEVEIENFLFEELKIKKFLNEDTNNSLLRVIKFNRMLKWDVRLNLNKISPKIMFNSEKYENISLASVCKINPITKFSKEVNEITFLPMESVSEVYGEIETYKSGDVTKSKGYTKFQENDILWAKITPCMENGKCVIAKKLLNGYGYGSTEFHVFRVNEKIIPEYLYIFLRTKFLRNVAKCYFSGSVGQQRVGVEFLENLTIPILPIDSIDDKVLTQKKLVNKIFCEKEKIKYYYTEAKRIKNKANSDLENEIFM